MIDYKMGTEEGNILIERIVDASVKLYKNNGASLLDVEGFVEANLTRLQDAGYEKAATLPVVKSILLQFAVRAEEL